MSNDLTLFLGGDLRVHQPSRGYRFNVDSVLLAGFARALEGERVLDLGTGSGILLLLLKWHGHPGGMAGVELQPGMAELARRNMEENGYGEGAAISEADLRGSGAFDEGSFGLVVSNPPYHR